MGLLRLGARLNDPRGQRAKLQLGAENAREHGDDRRVLGHRLEHPALVDQVPNMVRGAQPGQRVGSVDVRRRHGCASSSTRARASATWSALNSPSRTV